MILSCTDLSSCAPLGMVFNVQRYSVHDGPGIRTLVFFKGCPLRCRWCSNPESQAFEPELGYNESKCLRCGACVAACPHKALRLTAQGIVRLRKQGKLGELCANPADCHTTTALGRSHTGDSSMYSGVPTCVAACPATALTRYGQARTVIEVLDEVEQDSVFYARSGGGMTLSGGEAFAQPTFALALLTQARERRIHCAVETCGLLPLDTMLELCGKIDYLLLDIKCMDDAKHKSFTGVSNQRILANALAVRKAWPRLSIHVRTPVIPGFNDSNEAMQAIADFARSVEAVHFEPLAYHSMGRQKYHFLGLPYAMEDASLDKDFFEALAIRLAW